MAGATLRFIDKMCIFYLILNKLDNTLKYQINFSLSDIKINVYNIIPKASLQIIFIFHNTYIFGKNRNRNERNFI